MTARRETVTPRPDAGAPALDRLERCWAARGAAVQAALADTECFFAVHEAARAAGEHVAARAALLLAERALRRACRHARRGDRLGERWAARHASAARR